MARGNTQLHLHLCQSTGSPASLPGSVTFPANGILILPHLCFSDFITVQIAFPAPISYSPWKPSMHNMLIPLKKFSFDVPVLYFPSKQNSLQESSVTAISSSAHPVLSLPLLMHMLSMYSPHTHTLL